MWRSACIYYFKDVSVHVSVFVVSFSLLIASFGIDQMINVTEMKCYVLHDLERTLNMDMFQISHV